MAVDIADIKRLKTMTGVGLTTAKQALEESNGDFDKALEAMRIKGLAKADKKADREAAAGIVHAYVHSDKIGVLVELNCETDFVARTDDFKEIANDLALHIAASNPKYLSVGDIPEADTAKEKELTLAELKEQGKPADMVEKISEGKIKKWHTEVVLLEQPFVKNPDQTIENVIKEAIAKLGENIVLRQFSRIELGS
jgi:elongation factor Ts